MPPGRLGVRGRLAALVIIPMLSAIGLAAAVTGRIAMVDRAGASTVGGFTAAVIVIVLTLSLLVARSVARAFERAQETAVRLAERQAASRRSVAELVGHVGRRTQNLANRQLALVERLQRQSTDPGQQAELQRLDHISSRLRRIADCLVVLSGSTGADPHPAPLPLAGVVRLALDEIEDDTRVDVSVPAHLTVTPAVVGDLALTLAELVDNATAYSPPYTQVTVSAAATGAGVRINLVDHGVGMRPEQMAEANNRLTRCGPLDAPAKALGLVVVGLLARRHGWQVTLSATPGGGVTVEIQIDERLLVRGRTWPTTLPRRPTRPPFAPAATPTRLFDPEPVGRASRVLATGQPWDAFGLGQPAGTTENLGRAAGTTEDRENEADRPPVAEAPQRVAVPPLPTVSLSWSVPPSPAEEPAPSDPPSPSTRSGLVQRVPGATLNPAEAPTIRLPPPPFRPTDPDEVRRLITEFESGVARAHREVSPDHHGSEGSSR